MRDIKEPKHLWTGIGVWEAFPLVGIPFGVAAVWFGRQVLGIRDFLRLALFAGLVTLAGAGTLIYIFYDLLEGKHPSRKNSAK